MKCPFCGFENPAHANFCMSCGSPQDLKACDKCGTINQRSASICSGCGGSLLSSADETSAENAVPTSTGNQVPDTPHLEHQVAFKQLLAELEETIATHRDVSPTVSIEIGKKPSVVAPPPISQLLKQTETAATDKKIVAEPPSYMEHLISRQNTNTQRSNRGLLLAVIVTLFIVIGSGSYYVTNGFDLSSIKSILASLKPRKSFELTAPTSPSSEPSPSIPTPISPSETTSSPSPDLKPEESSQSATSKTP